MLTKNALFAFELMFDNFKLAFILNARRHRLFEQRIGQMSQSSRLLPVIYIASLYNIVLIIY